jgi:hypothetical protein
VKWKGEINSAGLNDLAGSEPDLVFDWAFEFSSETILMSIHWTRYDASSIVFWWN